MGAMEGAMEVEWTQIPPPLPPKLHGLNPKDPDYKLLLCPHGKPGNRVVLRRGRVLRAWPVRAQKQKQRETNEPAQCPLCNNGRNYAYGNLPQHIFTTKMHAAVSEDDKRAALWQAGDEGGYIVPLTLRK
jgi:hypothetical protein